ncbi:hypothetical protein, partial [Rhodoblastus sphagnicola]|uniref:hypothetical protein n=1 Tax=Rhodoblastus sphagnicola TaxID=333368 RepID=UPI0019D47E29
GGRAPPRVWRRQDMQREDNFYSSGLLLYTDRVRSLLGKQHPRKLIGGAAPDMDISLTYYWDKHR